MGGRDNFVNLSAMCVGDGALLCRGGVLIFMGGRVRCLSKPNVERGGGWHGMQCAVKCISRAVSLRTGYTIFLRPASSHLIRGRHCALSVAVVAVLCPPVFPHTSPRCPHQLLPCFQSAVQSPIAIAIGVIAAGHEAAVRQELLHLGGGAESWLLDMI